MGMGPSPSVQPSAMEALSRRLNMGSAAGTPGAGAPSPAYNTRPQ